MDDQSTSWLPHYLLHRADETQQGQNSSPRLQFLAFSFVNPIRSDPVQVLLTNLRWSSRIQVPPDVDFNEVVGMKVDMPENSTCLDLFELFFTHDVYNIILDETIRFERQKRQLEDSVAGNLQNCSVEEL